MTKIDSIIQEFNFLSYSNRLLSFQALFNKCESEIEKFFIAAYFYRCYIDKLKSNAKIILNNDKLNLKIDDISNGKYNYLLTDPILDHEIVYFILPQYKIDNFRVDFLLINLTKINNQVKISSKLVLECDGFEFHDRTPDLIQKDKNRDIYLKSQGFEVIRYSGKQLYHNPFECAFYVEKFLNQLDNINIYNDKKTWNLQNYKGIVNNISIKDIEKIRTEKQDSLLLQNRLVTKAMENFKTNNIPEDDMHPKDLEYISKLNELNLKINELKFVIDAEMRANNIEKGKLLMMEYSEIQIKKNQLKADYIDLNNQSLLS